MKLVLTANRRSSPSIPLCFKDLARRSRTNSLRRSEYSQPAGERSESALYECSISDCPDYESQLSVNDMINESDGQCTYSSKVYGPEAIVYVHQEENNS